MSLAGEVSLACHPATPARAALDVRATVVRSTDGAFAVTYVIHGDVDRIRVPPSRPAHFADELWRHTCFELFVKRQGGDAYREFNFSPSGEWAAYDFTSYRQLLALRDDVAIDVRVQRDSGKLTVDARVELDADEHTLRLVLGVSAVVEEIDGTLSYWALTHPADKPDFHRAEAFVVGSDPVSSGIGPGLIT